MRSDLTKNKVGFHYAEIGSLRSTAKTQNILWQLPRILFCTVGSHLNSALMTTTWSTISFCWNCRMYTPPFECARLLKRVFQVPLPVNFRESLSFLSHLRQIEKLRNLFNTQQMWNFFIQKLARLDCRIHSPHGQSCKSKRCRYSFCFSMLLKNAILFPHEVSLQLGWNFASTFTTNRLSSPGIFFRVPYRKRTQLFLLIRLIFTLLRWYASHKNLCIFSRLPFFRHGPFRPFTACSPTFRRKQKGFWMRFMVGRSLTIYPDTAI